jgi:hypothetical protein
LSESKDQLKLTAQIKVIKAGLSKVAETLKQIVEQLDEVERSPILRLQQMQQQPPSAQTQTKGQLSEEFLGGLPWKPYKGAIGEWIFSNLNSAQQLLKTVKEAPNQQLVIGKYRYQIQRNGKFIGRTPA